MDKVLIGNGLCNNDYIHAYIGHDLYKPLSEFTPSMCSGNIHSLFPGYQQMSYCKKKKKVSQNSTCQTDLCNPWLPWEPTKATTTTERLEFLKVLL